MKKIAFNIAFLLFCFVGFSQKDTASVDKKKMNLIMETQFYPRLNSGVFEPNIKARFVFSDEHVLRCNLKVIHQTNKREILEINGSGVGSIEDLSQDVMMSLGYEYLFSGNKLRPYLGFEMLLGVGKNQVYGSRTDSLIFVADYNYSSEVSSSHIGLGLFSGFDFIITDGLYVGTEIGLQLLTTKYARGEFKQMDASSTTDPEIITLIPESKDTFIGSSGVGVVRFGWRF